MAEQNQTVREGKKGNLIVIGPDIPVVVAALRALLESKTYGDGASRERAQKLLQRAEQRVL